MLLIKNRCKSTSILMALLMTASCGSNKQKQSAQETPPTPKATAPEVSGQDLPEDPAYNAVINNDQALREAVGLESWINAGHHGQQITIGILDNGFGGLQKASGKSLPAGLTVAPSPIKNESPTPHGTKLAEVITALTSGSALWTPQSQQPVLKLYNSNGYSNFSAAVDQAIKDHVDIILYSQVWEFGGNFDGHGFINNVVNKAVSAGILWINAAGNYAASSWQGPLRINQDQTANLPWQQRYVRMSIKESSTPVKISLAWNDFAEAKEWRTYRDLDLVLLDESGRVIDMATKIQDGRDHGNDAAYSAHARESLSAVLEAGTYLLRVDVKSHNFDGFSRFRLAADGAGVTFIDNAPEASVMIPADNPNVLTVGANDNAASSWGRTFSGISKPEVLAPSLIKCESEISFEGSSTAAAVAAATLAVYEGTCGRHSRTELVRRIRMGQLSKQTAAGPSISLPPQPVCW